MLSFNIHIEATERTTATAVRRYKREKVRSFCFFCLLYLQTAVTAAIINVLKNQSIPFQSRQSHQFCDFSVIFKPILWFAVVVVVTIIIILSVYQSGYSWPSHATRPYRPLLLAGLLGYIQYRHRAAVCRFTFACPCEGVHRSTSLMSSSLVLQQCPACLVRPIFDSFRDG